MRMDTVEPGLEGVPEEAILHPADSLAEPHPADSIDTPDLPSGPAGPPSGGPDGAPPSIENKDGDDEHDVERKLTKREMVEELKEKTKKARWNVFLFLGVGAIMFAFALFPMSTPGFWEGGNLESDPLDPVGQINTQVLVFGVPSMKIDVTVDVWVEDSFGGDIEVYLVPGTCDSNNLLYDTSEMKNYNSTAYALIKDAAPGSEHSVDLEVDPVGNHCFVAWYSQSPASPALEASVHVYSNRVPAGVLAAGSLFLSGFAFWGAQKHGKKMKELLIPPGKKSPEQEALDEAMKIRLSSGPGITPAEAPPVGSPSASGPPVSEPPSVAQTVESTESVAAEPQVDMVVANPPFSAPVENQEPAVEPLGVTEPASEPNYVPTGDGYFYIQNPDGSFQQQAYYQGPDGRYWPYS